MVIKSDYFINFALSDHRVKTLNMKFNALNDWKYRQQAIFMIAFITVFSVFLSCGRPEKEPPLDDKESLRRVLYIQSLYNNHPDDDIVLKMTEIIDSMKNAGRNPYYFAAVNILVDKLFSDGRFAEADSLAVNMAVEAREDEDSVSIAMAQRIRAQMYYKLCQHERALNELLPAQYLIANPYKSAPDFGTATSIQEWIWIISRELGDTATMNRAGLQYAKLVEDNRKINHWEDTTGHYAVTALAFKAQDAFSRHDLNATRFLLGEASSKIRKDFPSRAYEHFYEIRCKVRVDEGNWDGALADADTLLSTHKDFPWFQVRDLRLKAEVLNLAGKHREGIDAFSHYIGHRDSLSNHIMEKRLQDLTLLYRSELDAAQSRTSFFRVMALASAIFLLIILLAVAFYHVKRERKRNHLLVKRLKEIDDTSKIDDNVEVKSLIEQLDHYMISEKPYTNPALSRKELADHIGLSQTALGELVKNEKGISVRAYINAFRLEDARKTLGSTSEEGVAEMAVRLGFGTSRTLQRAFKERYDMSPTQYRNASKEIESFENQE